MQCAIYIQCTVLHLYCLYCVNQTYQDNAILTGLLPVEDTSTDKREAAGISWNMPTLQASLAYPCCSVSFLSLLNKIQGLTQPFLKNHDQRSWFHSHAGWWLLVLSLPLSHGLTDLIFSWSGVHQAPLCSRGDLHVSLLSTTFASSEITLYTQMGILHVHLVQVGSHHREENLLLVNRGKFYQLSYFHILAATDYLHNCSQLYSGCCLLALFAIITIFTGFSITASINCRVQGTLFHFSFAYSIPGLCRHGWWWYLCVTSCLLLPCKLWHPSPALLIISVHVHISTHCAAHVSEPTLFSMSGSGYCHHSVAIWERGWLPCTIVVSALLVDTLQDSLGHINVISDIFTPYSGYMW